MTALLSDTADHPPYTHTLHTHTHNLTHTSQWITCSDWSLSTRSRTDALYFYRAEMPDSSSRSYTRFCTFTWSDRFVLSYYWSWSLNVSQRSGRAAQQHPSVSTCLRTIHQSDQWAKKSMCSHSIILREISIFFMQKLCWQSRASSMNQPACVFLMLFSCGLMRQMHVEYSEQCRQGSGEKPVLSLSVSLEGCIFGISSLLSDPIENIHRGSGEPRVSPGFRNTVQGITRIRRCLHSL